ncbi:hypothetical protein RRG08_063198 [Elysia crispata]|uniref:Uncharacterized protein n=1 Tax=Elysia crispata TaxID=231223 RepID=A0AAE1D4F1_9GAST|nr:hypothetical protein RRG08_063198 [Elysia crispata]
MTRTHNNRNEGIQSQKRSFLHLALCMQLACIEAIPDPGDPQPHAALSSESYLAPRWRAGDLTDQKGGSNCE